MTLTWKTSWTGKECRIFRDKIIVGLLKTSVMRGDAYGELHGHLLVFKPISFWKTGTRILDIEGKTELGKIDYNWWKSTAVITYQDLVYEWNYESWTRKKWMVKSADNAAHFVRKGFWQSEGTIEYEDIPAPVILAAIYVQNYFMIMAASAS